MLEARAVALGVADGRLRVCGVEVEQRLAGHWVTRELRRLVRREGPLLADRVEMGERLGGVFVRGVILPVCEAVQPSGCCQSYPSWSLRSI